MNPFVGSGVGQSFQGLPPSSSSFSSFLGEDHFENVSNEFVAWLRGLGSSSSGGGGMRISEKIRLADLRASGAGRGVVALQDIPADEELFTIPRGILLVFENSALSRVPGFQEKARELGPWFTLILTMLYEYQQHRSSRWFPYLRVLPPALDTLMFWADEELAELQGSPVVARIGKAQADEAILKELLPIVVAHPEVFPPLDGVFRSFDSPNGREALLIFAHHMGSLIMAYAFDVEKGGSEVDDDGNRNDDEGQDEYLTDDEEASVEKAMVPLADMLNADADRNNARLFEEENHLVMRTIKPVAAGEELFNDYGDLPRSDLLRRYGYVTENYAKYDVIDLPLEGLCEAAGLGRLGLKDIERGEPHLEFLDRLEIADDGYTIPRFKIYNNTANAGIVNAKTLAKAIPEEILVVCHVLSAPTPQIEHYASRSKQPHPKWGAAEAETLLKAVTAQMAVYPTTPAQDAEVLASLSSMAASNDNDNNNDPLACRRRRRLAMAVQVRMGEKEILVQLRDLLTAFLVQLSQGQPTSTTASKRANSENPPAGAEKRRKN